MNFFNSLMDGNESGAKPTTGTAISSGNLTDIISTINNVISTVLGLLTAGVVILSIFIAYKFFTADSEDKRKNAKAQLIYAIIGVVVLIALLVFTPTVIDAVKKSLASN